MEPLAAAELLALWERGVASTPAARALDVLVAAGVADAAALPAGVRDALLFDLCATGVGRPYDAVASCTDCGELLDLQLDVGALGTASLGPRPAGRAAVTAAGHEVDVRVPTAGDLARLAAGDDPDDAAEDLLAACIVAARREDGSPLDAAELPAVVRDAVEDAMAAADPRAETLLALTCPECGATWTAALDAAAIAWGHVDDAAGAVAAEVSALATRYGWSERDVLAMSPARRRLYLAAAG